MKYFMMVLFVFTACKQSDNGSEVQSLDDLQRGTRLSESCRAPSTATLSYDASRIKAYGKSCGDMSSEYLKNLPAKSQVACKEVVESIKTLPNAYQTLLSKVGMSILVDTKANTKTITEEAFHSDEISTNNASSFWAAAGSGANSFVVTVVRAEPGKDLAKDISYSVLRSLGDFFARGVFSLSKTDSGFSFDIKQTSYLPQPYVDAQLSLSKKFLATVKNKDTNPLLKSIQGERNLASFVTSEALHQFYCNSKMSSEFETGKYKNLKTDLKKINAAIDAAVSRHSGVQTEPANTSLALTQTQFGGWADFFAMFSGGAGQRQFGQQSGNGQQGYAPTDADVPAFTQARPQPAASGNALANAFASAGCTSCGGNCNCGPGGCAAGCSCSSGGPCNCAGQAVAQQSLA